MKLLLTNVFFEEFGQIVKVVFKHHKDIKENDLSIKAKLTTKYLL